MINWRTISWFIIKFSEAINKQIYGEWWGDYIFWPQGLKWNDAKQYSLVYGPSLAGPNYSLKKQSFVFVLGFLLPPPRPCRRWSGDEKDPNVLGTQIMFDSVTCLTRAAYDGEYTINEQCKRDKTWSSARLRDVNTQASNKTIEETKNRRDYRNF